MSRRVFLIFAVLSCTLARAGEPIRDWSDWQKYHDAIVHPALSIKPPDLVRAKENIKRYPWAQKYFAKLQSAAGAASDAIAPDFLARMIPAETPGHDIFTPCPACRDLHKPAHPHGQWSWSPNKPDELRCEVCGTVFPNEKYPENIVLHTKWGKSQTLSFYGGEPFVVFGYEKCRPSFSANIRARKVYYMAQLARSMAEAHALSGEPRYAAAVRQILLRFTEVYPNWLVHVGYGEYADMDPHIAAAAIASLPQDELVYPPNKPNRALHTGYWSAGRASGSGQEGHFIQHLAEAYDLTVSAKDAKGAAIYSKDDRRAIEQDLLLEGTILFTADKGINNKAVTNRKAAALVGMCVGHPGLVRFGLEGFDKTMNEWFLPDGGTPESFSYEMMTLSAVVDLVQACRGYSDPPGYKDESGKRLEKLDLYRNAKYMQVWSGAVSSLQGDLTFPPCADTHVGKGISPSFVELLAANYPDRPQYLSLLREVCGKDSQNIPVSTAIYCRDAAMENRKAQAFALPDTCLPELRIGFMRSGETGRESLLLLSASRWGGHHHDDSLNLYYWKNGQELLSDLGYLWDHPKKSMTTRTLAHNTVIIDEKEQTTTDRGGDVVLFKTGPHVKVMRASSAAYPNAKIYSRTSALIDDGGGESYAIDFFDVQGGAKQDYVFHGPNMKFQIRSLVGDLPRDAVYDLENVRGGDADRVWSATWALASGLNFTAWSLGQSGEQAIIGDGWGQRDYHNTDVGAKLPYIVRRTTGASPKQFISIFEGHPAGKPHVIVPRKLDAPPDITAIMIDTPGGRDYVICAPDKSAVTIRTIDGPIESAGELSALSILYRKPRWAWSSGQPLKLDGERIEEVAGADSGADK